MDTLPKILRRFGNPEEKMDAEYQCAFFVLDWLPGQGETGRFWELALPLP
jgi:hypothetical protein